jgi:ethanolamine utilization microcompartment shell protein EutL
MQDKPTATELLDALAVFLRDEAAPRLEGALRFKALVGANVAGIVSREIALGAAQDRAQHARLVALLRGGDSPAEVHDLAAAVRDLSFELCRRIDAGEADSGPWREEVLAHLRATVDEKLAVDHPKPASASPRG